MRAAVWLCAAATLAQDPAFRTTTNLVVAPVTVTGRDGKPVDGLTAADFELFDNGKKQPFDADGFIPPIALIAAIQTGASAAAASTPLRRVGAKFGPLVAGDRGQAAVITYDAEVRVAQPFTRDMARVANAVGDIAPRSPGGKMLDAVELAIRMFREGPKDHRRVLLLMGESKDRGSAAKLADTATEAQKENVLIYSIAYSPFLTPFAVKQQEIPKSPGGANMNLIAIFEEIGRLGKENAADLLVHHSGGRRLGFLKQKALEKAVTAIGEELHAQYLLGFTPPPGSREGHHSLVVRVKSRPDAVVRARPGYWLAAP